MRQAIRWSMATLAIAPAPVLAQSGLDTARTLAPIQVIADQLLGTADSANQGVVEKERLDARPIYRTGEMLEAVPGLIVTQHSGEGKANQYFLRGFNLDHGTDLALTVDGMPVNMRTHGHGQGYADTNFVIPELVGSLAYRKGPYYAEEGDFASAGAVHLAYLDRLDKSILELGGGSFGYAKALSAGSTTLGAGTLLGALDLSRNDGPWSKPDNYNRANGVLRYAQGTKDDGFALTGMASSGRWTATNQIPMRAVENGTLDRFGTLNPTDGGRSDRYSLSGRWSRRGEDSATRVTGYVIRSDLKLYNDFTYFLSDPVNGDQFLQRDKRWVTGLDASHALYGTIGGLDNELVLGTQGRFDAIQVGLYNTVDRAVRATVRADRVRETSIGLYARDTLAWTDWLRTTAGLRADTFTGRVDSDFAPNSGSVSATKLSPKGGIVLGPWARTEYYLNAGMGYHSNDLRGATITLDPNDKTTPQSRVPLLVRSKGAEIGMRTRAIEGLETTAAVFVLDFASELVFAGDAGTTEASRPSRRTGIEITNTYRPWTWLALDFDAAFTRARFTTPDPVGDRIPGAAQVVLSAGFDIDDVGNWFGGMRWRYFGPRPLIEDDSVKSKPTSLVSARVGYRLTETVSIRGEVFNLFNQKASQIDYYYPSRLKGETDNVNDVHFHPVEPLSARVFVTATF